MLGQISLACPRVPQWIRTKSIAAHDRTPAVAVKDRYVNGGVHTAVQSAYNLSQS